MGFRTPSLAPQVASAFSVSTGGIADDASCEVSRQMQVQAQKAFDDIYAQLANCTSSVVRRSRIRPAAYLSDPPHRLPDPTHRSPDPTYRSPNPTHRSPNPTHAPLAGSHPPLAGSHLPLTESHPPLAGSHPPLAGSYPPAAGFRFCQVDIAFGGHDVTKASHIPSSAPDGEPGILISGILTSDGNPSSEPTVGPNTRIRHRDPTLAGSNLGSRPHMDPLNTS